MHEKEAAARQAQFDEGRRFIDLAKTMGVKYVRMFGDKVPKTKRATDSAREQRLIRSL